MPPTTDLLSTAEVADLLGASVATVNRWAASGKLPVAHALPGIRGARLFARSDVLVILEAEAADLARRTSLAEGATR